MIEWDADLAAGTVRFDELGYYVPNGGTAANTWTSAVVGVADNDLIIQTGDMLRGTDVLAFKIADTTPGGSTGGGDTGGGDGGGGGGTSGGPGSAPPTTTTGTSPSPTSEPAATRVATPPAPASAVAGAQKTTRRFASG